jgi:surface protein
MRRTNLVPLVAVLMSCNADGPTPTEPPTPVATTIELSSSGVTLDALGATATLTATVKDQGGAAISNQTVAWSTSDPAVATVSDGLVTAVGTGTSAITATSGSASATASATVTQVATVLTLSDTLLAFVSIGDTARLTPRVVDRGGSTMTVAVTWSSSDTLVAAVDSSGLVTSVGNGGASIRAGVGDVGTEAAATVSQVSAIVALSDSVLSFASLGDTMRVTAQVRDAAGVGVEGAEIVWASSDPTVATVSGGLVTAIANGVASVTATSGVATRSLSAMVRQIAASIELSEDSVRLAAVGDLRQLTATIRDQLGAPIAGTDVSWSSSDSSTVLVDATGTLTSVASGRASIIASSEGLEASVHVVSVPFFLDTNGHTVVCSTAALGDTATVGGRTYTKRDRSSLGQVVEASKVSGDYADVTGSCVSGLEDFSGLFEGVDGFDEDLGFWDMRTALTTTRMFAGATSFNGDLSSWDVSHVTSMDGMFEGATLFDQDITEWDVGSVQSMDSMFRNAAGFNQDLSTWCVSGIGGAPTAFADGAGRWSLPRPVWGTCSNVSTVATQVTAFPRLLVADGRATTTVTVYPRDAAGHFQELSPTDLTFQPVSVGTLGAVTRVGPGAYAVTYTAGTVAGPTTLTATLDQGSKVLASVEVNAFVPPGRIAFIRPSPVGDLVAGIYVWDFSKNQESLLWETGGARDPAWSPDGSTLAFRLGADVWAVGDDGQPARLLIANANYPAWSPDGQKIAFARRGASNISDLFIANADGSGEIQVTDSAYALAPSWSPLGETIAFAGRDGIYLLDIATSIRTRFPAALNSRPPTWSTDGMRIVFDENGDVFEAAIDGSSTLNLTRSPDVSEYGGVYAPDGSLLAHRASGPDCLGDGIYVMTPDRSMRYPLPLVPFQPGGCTGFWFQIAWGR